MLAPPPRIWPAPPPAHVNGAAAATRYGYTSLAQILPSPQDKGEEQQQAVGVYTDEPVKLRKETKQANSTTDWRRKERGRIKIEPGITPCQVQEVTTSSKHEQNGSIPVGIAVARQRVQQTTPPPLILTCEERSTNQVTGWSGPPPHWQYPGVDQNLPVQMPPLQLGRDPLSGQLLILPSANIGESMQRTVLWPGGSTTGGNSQPPPLVMPSPQPVLLSDRYVTLAPPSSAPSSAHHHHQEKRRTHDHSTTTIHGSSSGGLAVGLFPPPPPPQAPFLMMPFSHQNNSLLLSTHLTEHNLNTMVVTNHQLSESAVLNPMEVITSPVDGFGGGGMIQQLPPSVVISHTETNSFVRSDINAVYPSQPQVQTQSSQPPAPQIQQEQIVVKEEVEQLDEATEEEITEEEVKTEVMDASNQTESPEEESEIEEEIPIKLEDKACTTAEDEPPGPDTSGLELLLSSIAQYEKRSSSNEETFKSSSSDVSQNCEDKLEDNEWKDGSIQDGIQCGLGLLCTVAERCLEEEVVDVEKNESKPFPSPRIETVNDDNNDKRDEEDEELSETDRLSDDCDNTPEKEVNIKNIIVTEKKGEWYASAERDRDRLKLKIKRRPGRPKKKVKTRKRRSPNRREPPVLQPWSASPDGATSPLTSPPTLTPHKRKLSHDLSQESDEGSISSGGQPPPLSPACSSPSSSKKRKVGRPKKRGDETPQKTELIVTKSVPSNKAIGRILANKTGTPNQAPTSPPPPTMGSQNKIKPKLKAEAKVKEWNDDEDLDLSPGKENGLDDPLLSRSPLWKTPAKPKVISLSPPRKPKVNNIYKKLKIDEEESISKPTQSEIEKPADLPVKSKSPEHFVLKPTPRIIVPKQSPPTPAVKLPQRNEVKSPQHKPLSPPPQLKEEKSVPQVPDCKLTEDQLKSLPCRILSITNGQFYPGEVTKIIAPDIYEVHIYKERCRKPQILCREEILCSSVAEIHCPEDMFIPSGTRVCAYWSQQYSCFYPGRVVSNTASGQVPIDFDDGDNGTIERTSVRFLPQDYPLVEPQNPLGKRKRYNSTTSSDSQKNNDVVETNPEPENTSISSIEMDNKSEKCKTETTGNPKINEETNEDNSLDEAEKNSVIDGEGADEIMSVLQNFFQSEKEEALEIERKSRHGDKGHRHHKHHKHRAGCKTHKCKHKHLRSRKHKHSRDESKRKEESNGCTDKSSDGTSNSSSAIDKEVHEKDPGEGASLGHGATTLANTSKSKIAAFLPEKHEMWSWVGTGKKKGRSLGPRGKGLRILYDSIQRGKEVISVGDCAVFVSTGRPDRPFIGHIESFWQFQMKKNMTVKVSWFYHPEETIGCPDKLPHPGGLFRSSHIDSNDVQTISHRCEVLPFTQFCEKVNNIPGFVDTVYENHENYYLAGHYEPAATKLDLEPEVAAVCTKTKNEGETENPSDHENGN